MIWTILFLYSAGVVVVGLLWETGDWNWGWWPTIFRIYCWPVLTIIVLITRFLAGFNEEMKR